MGLGLGLASPSPTLTPTPNPYPNQVVRGRVLTLLERASPWCNDDELLCHALCKEEGFCCNDPNVGSNQLLSCAQACMIRARGTGEDECKATCSEQDASRGCFREVRVRVRVRVRLRLRLRLRG